MIDTFIVLAKEPVPGRAKTRLTPPLPPVDAAQVAAAALRDTIVAAQGIPARQRLLFFDGDPRGWLPSGWSYAAQPAGGLDVRIAAAFATAGPGPAVLVGMDTPQLQPTDVLAFDAQGYDACLGPCPDGGYWAIGFRDPRDAQRALPGIPMSRTDTAEKQYARLLALGLRVQELDPLTDVDTIADALDVAQVAADGAFAATIEYLADKWNRSVRTGRTH